MLDSLDTRLDRAAAALRGQSDPDAVARILLRARSPRTARRLPYRTTMIALTASLALVALWPRGPRAMAFAQVRAATLAAPRSIARTTWLQTAGTTRTVWREGERYAILSMTERGHPRFVLPEDVAPRPFQEVRSDGKRKLDSSQYLSRVQHRYKHPFGYRYAIIDGDFGLTEEERADTLAELLKAYATKAPEPVRIGDRLRYELPPVARYRGGNPVTIEADANTGRIVEVRDRDRRTVLDYDSPIPPETFAFRTVEPDIVVVDLDALRPLIKRDMDAGAGAWLDEEGKMWLVYRGLAAKPPKVAGLNVRAYVRAAPYSRGPVVAVGAKLGSRPPASLTVAGKRVPVRRIGRIMVASMLFNPIVHHGPRR